MVKNNIVILTGNENFFGQTRKPWVTMNVDRMKEILESNGFTVEIYNFHEIVNKPEPIKNSIIFYTFSQKRNIREYIKDLISYLDDGSNLVVPSYELLKCHENKGYQELYKRQLNFSSLNAYFFSDKSEIPFYDIKYPVVAKSVIGSNGKRVHLVKNEAELLKAVKRFEQVSFKDKIDLFRRKYLRPEKKFKEYPEYSNRADYDKYKDYVKRQKNFVLQEFVPDLAHDYRVLVIKDRYYVEMRYNRKNDFRASGAKKFNIKFEVDPKLMDYARLVYEKFDAPYLSIDIGERDGQFYLFEFQALHFGINVLINSAGYYITKNNDWNFVETKPEVEKEFSEGLIRYLKDKLN